jgi:hypothetical protein
MKKLIFILFVFITFIDLQTFAQSKLKNLEITPMGYSANFLNSHLITLKFEFTNTGLDTLYISRENIEVTVTKNNVVIESAKPGLGQVSFPRSRIKDSCSEFMNQLKKTEKMRIDFANKMFEKNCSDKKFLDQKEYFVETISYECIVILPGETIYYGNLFNCKPFDNTFVVTAKYNNKKVFCMYNSGEGMIEIKN